MPPEDTTTETPTAATTPIPADPDDDAILAAMAEERQKTKDDALLGKEGKDDVKPNGKATKKAPAKEETDDDEDETVDEEDDDSELDEEDDEADRVESRQLQKARKLFDKGNLKAALKAALNLTDDDLEAGPEWDELKYVNAKFRAHRAKVAKDTADRKKSEAEHATRVAAFETYVKNAGAKLKPGFDAIKRAHEYRQTGDTTVGVALIEELLGEPYDKFAKKVLKGTPANVSERRLQAKISELEGKLEKLGQPKTETPEEKLAKAQVEIREYLAEIKAEIAEHDVRKIPGAAKKVLRLLRKNYDPKLKAPKISVEKAADLVLKQHMRLVDRLAPKTANDTKKPTKVLAHSRAETAESKPADDDLDDDAILAQLEIERAKRRAEERAKGKKVARR